MSKVSLTQDAIGYGTFKAFTDFAARSVDAGKSKAIARVPVNVQSGPLTGRSISAATTDKVFKFFRSSDDQKANDKTRTIFRSAIADMFGGESKIPPSVKKAMLEADYGKGKPLTARRIMAVKTAIDQLADLDNKLKLCIAGSKADFGYTDDGREACDKMIETAYAACNGNPDAIDIVRANTRPLTVNNASRLRSEAEVQNKIGKLIDNLNELKELSKDNPAIYAAGKRMLEDSGVSLPKGMFAKLVKVVNEAPINAFQKLSGGSSVMDIHRAVMQIHKSTKEAMVSSGAEHLDGPDERTAARDFIAMALLSRCDKGCLANIRKALDSRNASALYEHYSVTEAGRSGFAEDLSDDVKEGLRDAGRLGYTYMDKLNKVVNDNLQWLNPGTFEGSKIKNFKGDFDINKFGGGELVEETISIAKAINAEYAENCVNEIVTGDGEGADAMKNVLRTKLGGGSFNSKAILNGRLSDTANAMMNWSICAEMKKMVADGGAKSFFKGDIARSMSATLSAGGKTIKLSNNFETARNQLAQFVTGDPKATYGGLAKAADKNKVHLLMAILSQETEKAGENGAQIALDTREATQVFTMGGLPDASKQGTRTFAIEKTEDGGLTMQYTMDKPINCVTANMETYDVGEGSKFTCEIEYKLDGSEVNRLAELDYSKFDDKEGYKIFNDLVDIDGVKQFQDHKLEKVMDTFAQEFKVNADCEMNFSLTLTPPPAEEDE